MKRVVEYLQNESTQGMVVEKIHENIFLYTAINTRERLEDFAGHLYNHFVSECVANNQYVAISKDQFAQIHSIYKKLILSLRSICGKENLREAITKIVRGHRKNLIAVLDVPESDKNSALIVPCAEYSSDFQRRILRIDEVALLEPIIDIGCGKRRNLVENLSRGGHSVFGLDQYISSDANIFCGSWFDFDFLDETWGTVIAHMSFTNHFRRSHFLNASDQNQYTEKYFEILNSLQVGGTFSYTPRLPQVEKVIDQGRFEVSSYSNIPGDATLDTVHVRRVSR